MYRFLWRFRSCVSTNQMLISNICNSVIFKRWLINVSCCMRLSIFIFNLSFLYFSYMYIYIYISFFYFCLTSTWNDTYHFYLFHIIHLLSNPYLTARCVSFRNFTFLFCLSNTFLCGTDFSMFYLRKIIWEYTFVFFRARSRFLKNRVCLLARFSAETSKRMSAYIRRTLLLPAKNRTKDTTVRDCLRTS